jgi:hypothetical protein
MAAATHDRGTLLRDDVGPHPHQWQLVGRDAEGEIYEVCTVCNARRCVHRPRYEARRQDWLEYREAWEPEIGPTPEPGQQAPELGGGDEDPEPARRGPGRPRKAP